MRITQKSFFLIILISISLNCYVSSTGNIYSTKFFEPSPYSKSLGIKVCLLPVEVKNSRIFEYMNNESMGVIIFELSESEMQNRKIEFIKIFTENIFSYLKAKKIFTELELCEKKKMDFQLHLILEEYTKEFTNPIHPIIALTFMAGIPVLFTYHESSIKIKMELIKSESQITSVYFEEYKDGIILNDDSYSNKAFIIRRNKVFSSPTAFYTDYIFDDLVKELYDKFNEKFPPVKR